MQKDLQGKKIHVCLPVNAMRNFLYIKCKLMNYFLCLLGYEVLVIFALSTVYWRCRLLLAECQIQKVL